MTDGDPIEAAPPASGPMVYWDARKWQLEIWRAGPRPDRPVSMAFVSPAWLTFRGRQLLAVDLLDVPVALSAACQAPRRPNGTQRQPGLPAEYDDGWLWISLAPGEGGRRLVGTARAEALLDGPLLAGVRLAFTADAEPEQEA